MILVDSRIGSVELAPHLQKLGLETEIAQLEFGDVAFEGNGAQGRVMVGVERKTLSDLLHCIDDGRLAAHQLPGMAQMYGRSFLAIEGSYRPHDPSGVLMQWFERGWGEVRYRSQRTMYSKLQRYLLSVQMSGVIVLHSRDLWGTAYNIHELYHWFSKRWSDHTSLRQTQKIALPTPALKPSLVRKWAADIEEVGVKLSEHAERRFKTPLALAQAAEVDWMQLPRVGALTAQKIVRQIRGDR